MESKEIVNIMVIGNRELCYAIIDALLAPSEKDSNSPYHLTVLTYPSQTLNLPPYVSLAAVGHKTSDFSFPSLASTFTGQDLVINTVMGGDYDIQMRIINAAISAGVKRFIPHEFGQDSLNEGVQERLSKGGDRARIIKHLQQMTSLRNTFEWIAIAVGCILDSMLVSGSLGFDLQWHSASVLGTGKEIFAATSLERVGMVARRVIQNWDKIKNQYLYTAGVLVSANEILVSLEKATASIWTVGYSDVDESIREAESRIERGFPDAGMFLMERSILYDRRLNTVHKFKHRSANGLLRLESETVEAIVGQAYHTLEHRGKPGCGCD